MPWVVGRSLAVSARAILAQDVAAPCTAEDQQTYKVLSDRLQLNPNVSVSPTSPQPCKQGDRVALATVLAGGFVDDPDWGMDENLPDAYDPRGYRAWMGGKTGLTSKGFRHMYFGGWSPLFPIRTFQIPVTAVGESPERVDTLGKGARELLRSHQEAWAMRALAWALHYIQDLGQPFHSVQVIHMGMVPWHQLLAWPPKQAFANLVAESTRTIANYHWAFEEYVHFKMTDPKDNPFADCLGDPARFKDPDMSWDPKHESPHDLAIAIAHASRRGATALGDAEYAFFGPELKRPGFSLPLKIGGSLDYTEFALRPDLMDARQAMHAAACRALANSVWASQQLVQWALQP